MQCLRLRGGCAASSTTRSRSTSKSRRPKSWSQQTRTATWCSSTSRTCPSSRGTFRRATPNQVGHVFCHLSLSRIARSYLLTGFGQADRGEERRFVASETGEPCDMLRFSLNTTRIVELEGNISKGSPTLGRLDTLFSFFFLHSVCIV